ncbi:MAG: hypothetical protein GOV00_00230 [Candidatus Altiarchaeota archaeon]|nr:hypothetical protein [Candidatus Altiarchaeota archaeon]
MISTIVFFVIGVIKIGGAFFSEPSTEKVNQVRSFIDNFKGELALVAGGGIQVKDYVSKFRPLGLPETFLDHLAIEMTHINAQFMARVLNGVHTRTFPEVKNQLDKLPITAGQTVGQSTDAVAATLTDYLKADLLILVKDVGGLYPKDPKEHPGMRVIHQLSFEELRKFTKHDTKAGYYGVIDPTAINSIIRGKIPTYVVGLDFNFDEGTKIGPAP